MIANNTARAANLTKRNNESRPATLREVPCARFAYRRRPRVSTWLTVAEQDLVTAAGFERFATVHRESVDAIFDDFRSDRADAALVSVARVTASDSRCFEDLRRGFPGRPLIGLVLGGDESQVLASTLELGRDGIELVVDARQPSGWNRLRTVLCSPRMTDSFRVEVLSRIHSEVGTMARALSRFFDLIFDPAIHRTKQIADEMGIGRSAFHSRFHRASLPSARRYLDMARLVRVAFIGQEPALTGSDISNRVHASSPQSLHRSIRCLTGLSFREFRYRYDGSAMIERFLRELVTPNAVRLRSFDPRGSVRDRRISESG